MLFAHDIFRLTVRPFAKQVQAHLEPSMFMHVQERLQQHIQAAQEAVRRLRRIMAVAALCRQHASADDLARFIAAHRRGLPGKMFPTFFDHASDISASATLTEGA